MKAHHIQWKFSYMNADGNVVFITGNENDESSAIKQLWQLGSKYKCRSIDSFFISKDGKSIQVSPLSGKVKRI